MIHRQGLPYLLAASAGLSNRRCAADIHSMATFWLWGVRNFFVALVALVAFAGYRGVADTSIVMVTILGLAFIAEVGNRAGRRALRKKRRNKAAVAAIRDAAELRDRLRAGEQRRAA